MKKDIYPIVLLTFTVLTFQTLKGQSPNLERTTTTDGYSGKVHTVKKHLLWLPKDSTYILDTILRFNSELVGLTEYDKLGRKIYTRGFSGPKPLIREVIYDYDRNNRLIKETSKAIHGEYRNTITYEYDEENNEISKLDSMGAIMDLGVKIHKSLYHLDSIGRIILIEYISDKNATVKHSKREYNFDSKISYFKSYNGGILKQESWYKYDTLGNRKEIRSILGENQKLSIGEYTWTGTNEKRYTRRDDLNQLDVDNTEYYIFDKFGNKVKEYMVNNLTGRQLEIEWDIEYYE